MLKIIVGPAVSGFMKRCQTFEEMDLAGPAICTLKTWKLTTYWATIKPMIKRGVEANPSSHFKRSP